ncbi:unnamed protein product [Urochloa humidicola]
MSPGGGDDDDAGEHLTVEYRFSPGKVFHLIEQLSEEQAELVRSIGFGGLLDLPRYDKLDRHFSAWIFNQITSVTTGAAAAASMSDGGGAEVRLTARDVHEVLGVPHGQRPLGLGAMEGDVVAVRRALGLTPREGQQVTLKHARKVLDKLTAPPPPPSSSGSRRAMAQPERDEFVVAFLVFVVGHFLAPRGPGERTNADVFHALANPSEVDQFDWAGYVLRQLLDCAGRVRRQLAAAALPSPRSSSPGASSFSRCSTWRDWIPSGHSLSGGLALPPTTATRCARISRRTAAPCAARVASRRSASSGYITSSNCISLSRSGIPDGRVHNLFDLSRAVCGAQGLPGTAEEMPGDTG